MSTAGEIRVRFHTEGAVGIVSLARPEKRNALDDLTVSELRAAFTRAAGDDDVRVILLRAEGRDFCAGADLSQLERIASGLGPLENLQDAAALGQLFDQRHGADQLAARPGARSRASLGGRARSRALPARPRSSFGPSCA